MSVIPIIPENVDYLKRAARSALPQVGSSHLSEALAALLGYRTQAALLAAMSGTSRVPMLVMPNPGRLHGRLRDFGYDIPGIAETAEALANAVVPSPTWREFGAGDIDGRNAWFKSCQRLGLPYVYVTTRRTLARLDWDWISVDPSHDGKLIKPNKRHVTGRLLEAFRKATVPRKAEFDGSALVGKVDGLTIDAARLLAPEVAIILNQTLRDDMLAVA